MKSSTLEVCRACFWNATHRVFPLGGIRDERESYPLTENLLIPVNWKTPAQSCTIFILLSYSLYAQVMLFLFLINVQYLHVVISLEKVSNDQIHSSSVSHHLMKKSLPARARILSYWGGGDFPNQLTQFRKPWTTIFLLNCPTANFRPFSRGQSH